jgi:hypothetical protein
VFAAFNFQNTNKQHNNNNNNNNKRNRYLSMDDEEGKVHQSNDELFKAQLYSTFKTSGIVDDLKVTQ